MSDTSEHVPEPKKAHTYGLVQKSRFWFQNQLQRKNCDSFQKKRKPLNKDGTASEDNTLPEMVKDRANRHSMLIMRGRNFLQIHHPTTQILDLRVLKISLIQILLLKGLPKNQRKDLEWRLHHWQVLVLPFLSKTIPQLAHLKPNTSVEWNTTWLKSTKMIPAEVSHFFQRTKQQKCPLCSSFESNLAKHLRKYCVINRVSTSEEPPKETSKLLHVAQQRIHDVCLEWAFRPRKTPFSLNFLPRLQGDQILRIIWFEVMNVSQMSQHRVPSIWVILAANVTLENFFRIHLECFYLNKPNKALVAHTFFL